MHPSTESASRWSRAPRPAFASQRCALALAGAATGTAVCISVLAGWQRGGWLSERLLWVAIGAVLVISAHMLPALCRSMPPAIRCVAAVLWAACMAATCYGHATFFLMAQQHAGEIRAVAVTAPAPIGNVGRSLTQIANDRAAAVSELAAVTARRCTRDCSATRTQRAILTARLDALEVEATEARRQEAAADRLTSQQDRAAALRDSMHADPVTSRLAALLGSTAARVDLLSGLAFAAVLEGVACLLWFVALQCVVPASVMTVTQSDASPVTTSNEPVTPHYAPPIESSEPLEQPDRDLARLTAEIAAGRVRATVSDIRQYLGCSQTKAAALRRQFT